VILKNTDLAVSPLCLGTSELGSVVPEAEAFELLDLFVAQGGNFLDTALVYANWLPGARSTSERTIGRWLSSRRNRDAVVVATKGGHPNLDTMHISRLSPTEIVADIESSLCNLQVELIDLYYLHRDDPSRPVEEIMETLHQQHLAGKVRYAGCSNWQADRIEAANTYAAQLGWVGFVADQMLWNVAVVDLSTVSDQGIVGMSPDLYRWHADTGVAAIPFSSQAGGLFQKLAKRSKSALSSDVWRMHPEAPNRRRFRRLVEVAREMDVTITQVVLGYLLSQPFCTVPIVGCKTLAHLHDSLSAVGTRLTASQLAYLDGG
jgi:aryl-alcohol dehydrogenase-like predicted oxidoreductase